MGHTERSLCHHCGQRSNNCSCRYKKLCRFVTMICTKFKISVTSSSGEIGRNVKNVRTKNEQVSVSATTEISIIGMSRRRPVRDENRFLGRIPTIL